MHSNARVLDVQSYAVFGFGLLSELQRTALLPFNQGYDLNQKIPPELLRGILIENQTR